MINHSDYFLKWNYNYTDIIYYIILCYIILQYIKIYHTIIKKYKKKDRDSDFKLKSTILFNL